MMPRPESKKTFLHFPDERDCVAILDILKGYSPEGRELVLAVVRANMARYPRISVAPGCVDKARVVEIATPEVTAPACELERDVDEAIATRDLNRAVTLLHEVRGMQSIAMSVFLEARLRAGFGEEIAR